MELAAVPAAGAAELQYAPPPRGAGVGRRWAVLGGGLVTSAVAVVGVYLLARFEHEDPFAWHAAFVIPVGSAVTAVVAAGGYAVAARVAHVRASRRLSTAMAVLGMAVYVAAVYVQFAPFHWVSRQTGVPVTFVQFVRDRSEGWTWRFQGQTVRLGMLGYAYRLLDVAMFAGTAWFAGKLTRDAAYCDLCQAYLSHRKLAVFPASLAYRSTGGMSAGDRAEYQAEQQEQTRAAVEAAGHLMTVAAAGDVESVRQVVESVRVDRRAIDGLPTRVEVALTTCPVCRTTTLRTALRVGRVYRELETRAVSGAFADLA